LYCIKNVWKRIVLSERERNKLSVSCISQHYCTLKQKCYYKKVVLRNYLSCSDITHYCYRFCYKKLDREILSILLYYWPLQWNVIVEKRLRNVFCLTLLWAITAWELFFKNWYKFFWVQLIVPNPNPFLQTIFAVLLYV